MRQPPPALSTESKTKKQRGCGHLCVQLACVQSVHLAQGQRLQPNLSDLFPQRAERPREMHVLLVEARKKLNRGPFEAQDYWPWGKGAQRATRVLARKTGTCGGRQVDACLVLRGSFSPDSYRTHTGSASSERLTHSLLFSEPTCSCCVMHRLSLPHSRELRRELYKGEVASFSLKARPMTIGLPGLLVEKKDYSDFS